MVVIGVILKIISLFRKPKENVQLVEESIPLSTPHGTTEIPEFEPTPFQFVLRWTLRYFVVVFSNFAVFSTSSTLVSQIEHLLCSVA